VCSWSGVCEDPEVATSASTPQVHNWQPPDTQPQWSSEREGCRSGTQRSPRWTDVCPSNLPSLHQCRPLAQRCQSTAGGSRNLGSTIDNAEGASQQ
jgi:hypothetical protein